MGMMTGSDAGTAECVFNLADIIIYTHCNKRKTANEGKGERGIFRTITTQTKRGQHETASARRRSAPLKAARGRGLLHAVHKQGAHLVVDGRRASPSLVLLLVLLQELLVPHDWERVRFNETE